MQMHDYTYSRPWYQAILATARRASITYQDWVARLLDPQHDAQAPQGAASRQPTLAATGLPVGTGVGQAVPHLQPRLHAPAQAAARRLHLDFGGGANADYFYTQAWENPDHLYLVLDPAIARAPHACHRASADVMISSPLLTSTYERLLPDCEAHSERASGCEAPHV